MRRFLAAAFLVALVALPLSAGAQGQGGHGRLLGVVPPRGVVTPSVASQLLYHGGAVMRTNTAYAIYWIPSGYTVSSGYQSTINGFFTNVAAASGQSSNVYASDTQYSDNTGSIAYASTFGGTYVDTKPLPASGCTDSYTPVCLTDAQIENEINGDITSAGWTRSSTKLFFMFTAKNVGSCFDATSTSCAFSEYCAYHSWGGSNLIYANQPYASTAPSRCDSGSHPNGDDADATINVTSHEHNEAITDPTGVGWWDSNGEENGDKCAWTFGSPLGTTGFGTYNQLINGGHYYLQQEWSNAGSHCVLTYGSGGGASPAVSSFAPTSGAVGSSVTITGSNFTGTTAVKFNGTAASFTVDSATQITATVPSGATTGAVSVTTPSGTGTSSGNFTVTTSPAGPTISGFTPAKGPVGTTVKITGSGFVGTIGVQFNGVPASFNTVRAGSLKAVVPAGATTGTISVTTGGGTAFSSASFRVR